MARRLQGSLQNRLMENKDAAKIQAKVGDGATVTSFTDRYAGTVIKVTPTQIHVQEDNATRTDSNGMSEMQDYDYTPNPAGQVFVFYKSKHGFKCGTYGLVLGARMKYHDYSF